MPARLIMRDAVSRHHIHRAFRTLSHPSIKSPLAMPYQYNGYSIPEDLVNMTGGGTDTFEVISRGHIEYLQRQVGLDQHHHILEVGCGIGRDAIPLADILVPPGKYLGIDIIERSIAWCQNNITPHHPHVKFEHFNIQDNLHNPSGVIKTTDVTLPLPDNSTDRIILWSVLTHMFEDDITHYFREFERVLRPEGLVMATCFVVDDEILKIAKQVNLTQYNLRFETSLGDGCYINSPDSPKGAVAFTEAAILRMVTKSGLEMVKPILRGQWYGREGEGYGQDALILRRAAKPS